MEEESNYDLLLPILQEVAGQRSVVVLFTDVTKPSVTGALRTVLPALCQKHLTIIVSLTEGNYLLDQEVLRSEAEELTLERYNRLLYCYSVDERVEKFRRLAGSFSGGVITLSEKDWLSVIIKLYGLLRQSPNL